jgi:HSP20 family protein
MSLTLASEPPFGHLARQAGKLMDQMQKGYYNFYPGEAWTPNVNLYETDTLYLVCVDLAGVDKSKIDIEAVGNRLSIRGARAVPVFEADDAAREGESARKIRVHLMEIDHGSFSREVELPQGVPRERIAAIYRNGMLWIEIPKA